MAATYTLRSGASASARTWDSNADSIAYFPALNSTTLVVTLDAASQALSQSDTEVQKCTAIVVTTTGAAYTLSAAPTIPNGFDGQVITLVNASANPFIIQDGNTLSNTNLNFTGASITLGSFQSVQLIFNTEIGNWASISLNRRSIELTLSTASVSVSLTAAESIADTLLRTGAPAGAVADTTATGPQIITALGSVDTAGGHWRRVRVVNTTGQVITYTANATGVTVNGTATIANNAWRDFDLNVASATTVTYTNAGGGTV